MMTRAFVVMLMMCLSVDAMAKTIPVVCHEIPARLRSMRRPSSIEGATSYPYAKVVGSSSELQLLMHVFVPKQPTDHRAALVLFYGGGWSWGTVDQLVPLARYLRDRGLVVGIADYQVLCRDNSTPFDSVWDAKAALQFMHDYGPRFFRVDANRIAVGGESAGGQMALMTALADDVKFRPAALVLLDPGLDIADDADWARERFGNSIADDLIRISPLQQFQQTQVSLPRTLILNGDADNTTPIDKAKEFCAIANARTANTCKLVIIAGANHGFSNPPGFPAKQSLGGKWFARVLFEFDSFLDDIGYTYNESP